MRIFATKKCAHMTSSPTPPDVAEMATQPADLPDRGLLLLGVFGTSEDPRALIRVTSGRIRTIMPGDLVSGRLVAGIDDTSVFLARNGTTLKLSLPETVD